MMICQSSLPFLVLLCCTIAPSVLTAGCSKPRKPMFIVEQNRAIAYPDISKYNTNSTSLPFKCISEDFMLKEPTNSYCRNGMWQPLSVECVGLIYKERLVTNKIMIASGVVFGVLAATFVIVKFILYKRGLNKDGKLRPSGSPMNDNMELKNMDMSDYGMTRPTSRFAFENDAFNTHGNEKKSLDSFQSRTSHLYNQPWHTGHYGNIEGGREFMNSDHL